MARRFAWVVVVLLLSVSCTPYVQVMRYPGSPALSAHPPDCTLRAYGEGEAVPAGCTPIGDVFVGEGGSTLSCGRDELLEVVRKKSCSVGADAYQVIRVSEPVSGSSCHQARARFLRCTSAPASTGGQS